MVIAVCRRTSRIGSHLPDINRAQYDPTHARGGGGWLRNQHPMATAKTKSSCFPVLAA